MSRENIFDAAKSNLWRFLRTVRDDFSSVHDRSGENGAESRVSNRPNGFKGAITVRIEKIVLTDGGDAAADCFDATQQ